ncbi:hypothetical protein GJA_5410 [Janthinobacterium agaricidamnosum NBRC 102515 = DSM 9628]|uniref:Uncharacterized protein n=1 Tax=Janthinobacterium agaricidamnosum NBRC 102515 = DSM 9628 TaxID=1349767 RepID=W0VDL7_9BURK|nr:hypothetical protein GJA_5410 [Janthinobacterium agaricidamnosum NBRC 102515 = DSM 9628]
MPRTEIIVQNPGSLPVCPLFRGYSQEETMGLSLRGTIKTL